MQRLQAGSEVHYTVNHSRFIGFALAAHDERELRRALGGIAQRYADAHHLAFAYRIKTEQGIASYCNDAGEPSGTAGRPILAQMEGFEVINAVVAVVRYFGGIKLGAGGLVRAYGGTAKMALEAATLAPYIEFAELRLNIDYAQLQPLTYHLNKAGGDIVAKAFGATVELVVKLPAAEAAAFRERYARKT